MKSVAIEKHLTAVFTAAKGKRWPADLGSQPTAEAVSAACRANRANTAVCAVHAMLLRPEGATLQVAADAASLLLGVTSPIHVNKVRTNLVRGLYVAVDGNGKRLGAMPKLGKVEVVRLALPDKAKAAKAAKPASKGKGKAAKPAAPKPAAEVAKPAEAAPQAS